MKLKALMFLQVLTISSSFAHVDGEWNSSSNPGKMSDGFTHKMSALPLEGRINDGTKGWSGDYWATFKGHINIRWNAPGRPGFNYVSPTKEQVQKMSLEALKRLSPTEKFDLFNGRYDYPLKAEIALKANPDAASWAGICHGWSPAAIHHNEPTPKMVTNPDGIVIPFGSSDIKAILSYYYASKHKKDRSYQVGKRCNTNAFGGITRPCKEDLNAGAFHLVMANMIAIKKEAFVADMDRLKEIWNQPVIGYKSKIVKDDLRPSHRAAKSAVKEMEIQTRFYYVKESRNSWEPQFGTRHQLTGFKDLTYRLEIDENGEIVGGRWTSKIRPDFLWNKQKAETFVGDFSRLSELLND